MRDISTHLQEEVVVKLKAHLKQSSAIDFFSLQDTADTSQDKAILALMQLQQRMITLGTFANGAPQALEPADTTKTVAQITTVPQETSQLTTMFSSALKLSTTEPTADLPGRLSVQQNKSLSPRAIVVSSSEVPPETVRNNLVVQDEATASSVRPSTPPYVPFARPESSFSARASADINSSARREANQYRPLATTTTKPGLFGLVKRTKVEPVVSPPENPLVDEYLADAAERESKRLSMTASFTTTTTSLYEPDHPALNPWEAYRPPSPTFSHTSQDSQNSRKAPSPPRSHKATPSIRSFNSMTRVPPATREILASNRQLTKIDPDDLLPSEHNNFAGFCKGAWRQQIGDRKRAMEERTRPGGMYAAAKYWQCKQCKFEGRLVPTDKKKAGYDMRVFKLVQGVQFRWEFMFKSHVRLNDSANGDPTKATFGCVFCCAQGAGTPQFDGVANFMKHLVVHRDPLPQGEVLYQMNCLVGRQATIDEDFDINISSRD